MKRIYEGKTKTIYQDQPNQLILVFKDDVTGVDGQFDPGANQVGLAIEGMGQRNLAMSQYFFEVLKEADIPTHYLAIDLAERQMTVRQAQPFGRGLEVITRFKAVGSFFRRYGDYIEEGADLTDYVEFTLKDDARQDPLITQDGLIALGIMTPTQYETLVALNLQIAHIIRDEMQAKGLELYDLKLEFGLDQETGEILLIDEISGGNMRVYQNGQYIEPMSLATFFMEAK